MVFTNQKAKFVFTHKLFLVRVPQSPLALHTLVGYLSSSKKGQELLGKSLQSVLGVWSDSSAIRHMDSRQHMWISKVIVLGVTCLKEEEMLHNKSGNVCLCKPCVAGCMSTCRSAYTVP